MSPLNAFVFRAAGRVTERDPGQPLPGRHKCAPHFRAAIITNQPTRAESCLTYKLMQMINDPQEQCALYCTMGFIQHFSHMQ